MFNLFKKKPKEEAAPAAEENPPQEEENSNGEEGEAKKKPETPSSADSLPANSSAALVKMGTDIDRLKASVDSFNEVRKTLSDRLSGLSEQIGELRAMILDRDRTVQEIELKAVKAADLVENVQPDKLMVELRKEDAKFEALKANLEGNDAIMNRMMEELRDIRKKIEFFRGLEEVVKLSEEVKKDLIGVKKVEASIQINTEKADTMYTELKKKFQEIEFFRGNIEELKVNIEQNGKDIDFLKNKTSMLADKEELDKLTTRVQKYVEALKNINKTSNLTKDIAQLKSLLEGI